MKICKSLLFIVSIGVDFNFVSAKSIRGNELVEADGDVPDEQRKLFWSGLSSKKDEKRYKTDGWLSEFVGADVADELQNEWSNIREKSIPKEDINYPDLKNPFQGLWLQLTRSLVKSKLLPVDAAGGKHREHRNTIARYYMDKFLKTVGYLGKGKRCAEIGDKHFLKTYFKECSSMWAIDLKDPLADVLMDLMNPDWSSPNVDKGGYDLIMIGEVMEHIDQPEVALKTLSALLKPGGYLVWTTPFLMQYHANPGDHNRYTGTMISNMFTRAGLEPEQVISYGNWLSVTMYLAGFATDELHPEEFDKGDMDKTRPYVLDVCAVGKKKY